MHFWIFGRWTGQQRGRLVLQILIKEGKNIGIHNLQRSAPIQRTSLREKPFERR
jgi:hypothetical protein